MPVKGFWTRGGSTSLKSAHAVVKPACFCIAFTPMAVTSHVSAVRSLVKPTSMPDRMPAVSVCHSQTRELVFVVLCPDSTTRTL